MRASWAVDQVVVGRADIKPMHIALAEGLSAKFIPMKIGASLRSGNGVLAVVQRLSSRRFSLTQSSPAGRGALQATAHHLLHVASYVGEF